MDIDSFIKRLEPWRRRHRRSAYVPRLGEGTCASHFGGAPAMLSNEPWPNCRQCNKPMLFLLELDLHSLPKKLAGNGFLQLFYCSTDDGSCETWSPFTG